MLDCLDDLHQFLLKHNVTRPVVLMMDGHLGHYGLEIAEYCDQKEIQIWLFSAHMTHHLQPLDLVMFAPVKREMQSLSQAWIAANPGQTLSKYTMITEAAYPAMEKVCTPELIKKSWEVSGVFPWDEERPRRNGKFGPSEIFKDNDDHDHDHSSPDPDQPPQMPGSRGNGRGDTCDPITGGKCKCQNNNITDASNLSNVNEECSKCQPYLIGDQRNDDDDVGPTLPSHGLVFPHGQSVDLDQDLTNKETDVGHRHHEPPENDEDPMVSVWALAYERQVSLESFIIKEIRGMHGVDVTKEKGALLRVKKTAEYAKNELNIKEEVDISLPFLTVTKGNYVSFTMKLTRDKFAEIHRERQIEADTHLSVPEVMTKVAESHPCLLEAANNLAAAVHEEKQASARSGPSAASEPEASARGGSYYLDEMPDDEMDTEEGGERLRVSGEGEMTERRESCDTAGHITAAESHPLADLGAFVTRAASSPPTPATSVSAAASVPASTETGDQTSAPKKMPLEVRRSQLRKYELLMLDVDGVKKAEYERLFSEKKFFEVRDTAYRAWLLFKIDAVGDEQESVDALLESLIPKNVAKRKTKRKTLTHAIQGPDRYNPLSDAFKEKLRQVEEKKQKKGL